MRKSTQQPFVVPWFTRCCHLKRETSIYNRLNYYYFFMTFAWRVSWVTFVTWSPPPRFLLLGLSSLCTCTETLNSGPFSGPWCDDTDWSLWQACGKGWEKVGGGGGTKDKLQVPFGVLKDTVHDNQAAVKASWPRRPTGGPRFSLIFGNPPINSFWGVCHIDLCEMSNIFFQR